MTEIEAPWKATGCVELIAGTAEGGGLDRTARALKQAIESERLLDVPLTVVNLPGDGARRPWGLLAQHPGDAHRLSISSPNLSTDWLTGIADFDHSGFTPLAILYTEYIAFAVRADSPLRNGADLLAALRRDAAGLTVALSTSLGNPNHIALAKVIHAADADPKLPDLRVFDSALDAVADVLAGNAVVGAVTAASTLRAMASGSIRLLAISAPARLAGAFAATPTWREHNVDCVIGAWRGVSGPPGLTESQVAFWDGVLEAATRSPAWLAGLDGMGWSAAYLGGRALLDELQREHEEMRAALAALDLLRR